MLFMVHIWVINEHATSHSRLKAYVQKGLQLPALLYITEDADKRGLQVQQIEQSALSQFAENVLAGHAPELSSDVVVVPNELETNFGDMGCLGLYGEPVQSAIQSATPPTVDLEKQNVPRHGVDGGLEKSLAMSRAKSGALHEQLSVRELQTLMLLGQGLSVSGIARNLALSVKTISTYRARALDKLHLTTTADLIRYAVEYLLLPSSDITNHAIGHRLG